MRPGVVSRTLQVSAGSRPAREKKIHPRMPQDRGEKKKKAHVNAAFAPAFRYFFRLTQTGVLSLRASMNYAPT